MRCHMDTESTDSTNKQLVVQNPVVDELTDSTADQENDQLLEENSLRAMHQANASRHHDCSFHDEAYGNLGRRSS